MIKTAKSWTRAKRQDLDRFLRSRVDIETGALSGPEAWLQVLIIPLALAMAALAIGAVLVLVK